MGVQRTATSIPVEAELALSKVLKRFKLWKPKFEPEGHRKSSRAPFSSEQLEISPSSSQSYLDVWVSVLEGAAEPGFCKLSRGLTLLAQ